MKPSEGVYPKMPMSEYGALDAANFSTLKHFKRSAAHVREAIVSPPEQTAAMLLGQATHSAILEPDLFAEEYAVAPQVDRRKKKDKEIWAQFEKDNHDKDILRREEWELCTAMAASVHGHPAVSNILAETGFNELSFIWKDAETDVLCKGRCDRLGYVMGNSAVIDVKTTEDASERAWIREVIKYQYHAQTAFYLDGLEKLSPSVERKFIWIVVEKKPPFCCALYQPDDATLAKGRSMYRKYLRQWVQCNETGVWPGYPSNIQPLLLPDWALRAEEGEDAF